MKGKGDNKGLGGGEASATQGWDGVKEKEEVGSLPEQIRKLFNRAGRRERV